MAEAPGYSGYLPRLPENPFWLAHREDLVVLWNQPLTTTEIALRLGTSKGAVVGKAARLGLPRRSFNAYRVAWADDRSL